MMEDHRQEWMYHPVPLIDPLRCDGCGPCVQVCPSNASVMHVEAGKGAVAHPVLCHYAGRCEAVCPAQAIARLFEVVMEPGLARPT